jgi:hypothetical protein
VPAPPVRHRRGRASPDAQERPRWNPRHSAPARPSSRVRVIAFRPESGLRSMMTNLPGDPLPCSLLRGSGPRGQETIPRIPPFVTTASRPCNYPESCGGGAAASLENDGAKRSHHSQVSGTHATSGLVNHKHAGRRPPSSRARDFCLQLDRHEGAAFTPQQNIFTTRAGLDLRGRQACRLRPSPTNASACEGDAIGRRLRSPTTLSGTCWRGQAGCRSSAVRVSRRRR